MSKEIQTEKVAALTARLVYAPTAFSPWQDRLLGISSGNDRECWWCCRDRDRQR